MATEGDLGTLVVVVLKAQNLIDKHSFYKQDAFAEITFNGMYFDNFTYSLLTII
jgi:hypothetical protein